MAFASCLKQEEKKKYDVSKPVDMIEALSNDVSASGDEWTKEDWDDAADALESALKNLPDPLADDETTIVSSSLSRMSVYAERHKRKAASFVELLNNSKLGQTADATPAPAAAPQAAATPAPAPQPVATPAPAPAPQPVVTSVPAGLLSGSVIREGGYTNVRQGPGTNYAIVTKIKDGSPIYYTVYNNKWCVVYDGAGNALGYMHTSKVIPSGASSAPRQQARIATGTAYDWLAYRYVTHQDVCNLSPSQLRILRNAIYARHGRRFQDAGLRQFFNSQVWYDGYRNEIPASELNKYEKYNISFIQKYE